MLISEIIASTRRELGDPSGIVHDDVRMLALYNEAENDFCAKTHTYQTKANLTTEYGVNTYDVPQNLLSVLLVKYNQFQQDGSDNGDDDWVDVKGLSINRINRLDRNFLSTKEDDYDTPRVYTIHNRQMEFYPIPNYSGTTSNALLYGDGFPDTTDRELTDDVELDQALIPALREYILYKSWLAEGETDLATAHLTAYNSLVEQGRVWKDNQSLDELRALDKDLTEDTWTRRWDLLS